jgi:hypothetical protein
MEFLEELTSMLAAGDTESGNLVFGFGRREGNWVRDKGSTINQTTLEIYEITASAATDQPTKAVDLPVKKWASGGDFCFTMTTIATNQSPFKLCFRTTIRDND